MMKSRWPLRVAPLGEMHGGNPFDRCIACGPDEHPAKSGTNVTYGGFPLCIGCALSLSVAGLRGLPFVTEALARAAKQAGSAEDARP